MGESLQCRSCGEGELRLVLDLGKQPLANNLLGEDDLEKEEPKFPLRLMVCPQCWLVQIGELVPPVELFSDYLYFSSFSDTMLAHAEKAVAGYREEWKLDSESLVVEIASNDGYLLKNFNEAGIPCYGIEPAENVAEVARKVGVETIVSFFDSGLAETLAGERGAADLILGNNVFAHVPDTNDFVLGLKRLLAPGGRVVLEFPYAVDFLEGCEFDTIYHEHVFYFSLSALRPLFERHGLEIFRVERLPIHGGSLRLFAGHDGDFEVEGSVGGAIDEEGAMGVDSMDLYEGFAARAHEIKRELRGLVGELREDGKTISAYGASAKGSTLLNFSEIGPESLEFVADRSTVKQGRYTPGTRIPIVSDAELGRRRPDYALLLTWNFADEILEQQSAYREGGGKFILPIPTVRVV